MTIRNPMFPADSPARPVTTRAIVRCADPATMPDFYILTCEGECMAPEIPNGAPVLVDKHGKFGPGDLVVLFFRPEHVPAGMHQAILKRLAMALPPWVRRFPFREHPESEVHALVVVECTNPLRRFAYKAEHLLGIHRCHGTLPNDAVHDPKRKSWTIPSLAVPQVGIRRPEAVRT